MTQPQLIRADYDEDKRVLTVTTITLRDFFAAFALAGLNANESFPSERVAELAYKDADAMLEYRRKFQEEVTK